MRPEVLVRRIGRVLAVVLWLVILNTDAAATGVKHVVIVGVDGLRADGVTKGDTPNMHKLMARGAYTLTAHPVKPTVSNPNWASIIMGAGPETHGITSNDWEPGKTPIFPTIFQVLREQKHRAFIAVVYEWRGFGRLFQHGGVDFNRSPLKEMGKPDGGKESPARAVTNAAVGVIRKNKPTLTFVHLDLVDHAGHYRGYGSPQYLAAVAEADRHIGEIVQAINDARISDKTVILVVSDHGGQGTSHGGESKEEMEVPWIIAGPGVAAGKQLAAPVEVTQTAPTVTRILGLKPPAVWTARPVLEALTKP